MTAVAKAVLVVGLIVAVVVIMKKRMWVIAVSGEYQSDDTSSHQMSDDSRLK